METLLQEVGATMPDGPQLIRVMLRLLAALAVGALIGFQRERMVKAAGLRTHMLVAMGTALFVICAVEAQMGPDAVSRVLQGLITGIGFLGAGVVMKIQEAKEIRGLTTAAGVWMTAAASATVGLGQIGVGLIAAVMAWVVLAILYKFEPAPKADQPHGTA
jgi:putative Mg2+ transporter-C (MgtC) family protein